MNSENLTAWILLIASMAMAIFVSFLCSLLESALLSLTPSQLAEISARNPRKGDLVSKLKDDIEKPPGINGQTRRGIYDLLYDADTYRGAFSLFALDRNKAVHETDKAVYDGKAETDAARAPVAFFVGLKPSF